ncbi:MAG TPA: hypothetical protein VF423_15010 [Actinomycetes bacterium]
MTALEDQVRATLHDMAEEAQPVALLPRLDEQPQVDVRQRRLVLSGIAAAAAVVLAVSSLLVLRLDRPSIVEPVDHPPKVFRLSGVTAPDPGRADLAVTVAGSHGPDATFLLPSTGGAAIRLTMSERVPESFSRHLSTDGTRLIRQHNSTLSFRVEVVDLRTGAANQLGDERGYCPQLSPDNRTVAMYDLDDKLALVDVRSGDVRPGPRDPFPPSPDGISGYCAGIGWSPDSGSIVVPVAKGSVVADVRGRMLHRLPDRRAVNNSMSWSPDGRLILLYDPGAVRFVVHDLESGSESVLEPPGDALRPLGWAGSRVVWLAGRPGDQRLVTTDQRGADPRTWTNLAVGSRVVETVTWSQTLAGTARD